jgi:hypothetical protein
MRCFRDRPDWQIALAFTCALRVVFSIIAAALSFVEHPAIETIRSNSLPESLPTPGTWHYAFLGVWERFDTLWYLHIAQHGYDLPMAVIFYPLYPVAIRALSWARPPIVAALLISTIAAFFFFLGMLRLGRTDLSDAGRIRMLLLIAVWPTSFVLFAGYSESLAAALVVWAVVFARERRWELAAFCGLHAGLGRPSGVLVCVPLFVMAACSRQLRALAVLLSPAGWLGYWGWLRWSGRLPVWEAYRVYQETPMAAPWEGLWLALRTIVHGDPVLAIKLGLITLALVFSLRRDIRIEDKLFAIAVIVQMFMYTGRPIIGAARYVLMVYPAFLGWAAFAQTHWKRWQFAVYAAGLAMLNFGWMFAFLKWSLVL